MAQVTAMLPEFNCYANGKQPETYPSEAAVRLSHLKHVTLKKLLDAEEAEEQRNYIKAA